MKKVKLLEKRWIATSTAHIILEKPEGYTFTAGQYFAVRLPNESGRKSSAKDFTHTFTIASAPTEENLSFATRMRGSAFKKRLDSLETEATLEVTEPSGEFQLQLSADRPPVLIAGGIGITPFLSMLNDLAEDDIPVPVVLLYSNRRPQDAPFLQELRQMEEQQERFQMIATITEPDFAELAWSGETGRIDTDLLKQAAPRPDSFEFYIAGPPAMADAMKSLVQKSGAPANQIHIEQFAGYEKNPTGEPEGE